MPIILLLYGSPQITILPIFILYFGIGAASKIAFGVTHGMFPDHHHRCGRRAEPQTYPADQRPLHGREPLAHPALGDLSAHDSELFAGMRLGMTGVLLGVLLAELYVSTAGIGHFTTLFTENFDPTKLFGLVAMLAAMAIVLNEIVRRAELRSAAGE